MTDQELLDEVEQPLAGRVFEEEVGKQQLAVARDANEIARSASYAASDAAAAARFQARVSMAALAIAIVALVVSVVTPDRIASYVDAQPRLLRTLR